MTINFGSPIKLYCNGKENDGKDCNRVLDETSLTGHFQCILCSSSFCGLCEHESCLHLDGYPDAEVLYCTVCGDDADNSTHIAQLASNSGSVHSVSGGKPTAATKPAATKPAATKPAAAKPTKPKRKLQMVDSSSGGSSHEDAPNDAGGERRPARRVASGTIDVDAMPSDSQEDASDAAKPPRKVIANSLLTDAFLELANQTAPDELFACLLRPELRHDEPNDTPFVVDMLYVRVT